MNRNSNEECMQQTGIPKNLKENIPHGDMLFHMSVHHTVVSEKQDIILYCHWHEELEILFITRGAAQFHVNGEIYEISEGEIVFISPNEVHTAYRVNNDDVEFYAVLIHSDFVNSMINDIVQQKYIQPLFLSKNDFPVLINKTIEKKLLILPILYDIKNAYFEHKFGYELLIKFKIYELLYKVICYGKQEKRDWKPTKSYKTERIKNVVLYIQKNYKYKITLIDLASSVNMSAGAFCRFFKQYINMTPIEYLNSFRITKATYLLQTTDKKLIDIALDTGFSNINYFTDVFKKVLYCTPTEYRNRLNRK
ncbi:AraC family transcriptional regulator [Clostridium oryzae]|uniref:HTH-type transcriptional activator Btr n=1 Tax=Clostridium oryzae TaxID=1450648 RepID=A0A1V4ID82_9CLOT|nr:AraC family transcriptional regulator [Clostridium oryzae]OPJ57605.1 HTH-type transcriptional activator Btr [Clostridium oryzae]